MSSPAAEEQEDKEQPSADSVTGQPAKAGFVRTDPDFNPGAVNPGAVNPGASTTGARRLTPGAWNLALAALLGLTALVIYVRTLSVSISWGDSPEMTTAAYYAGIPHPTGYPLYMLLGHAFIHAVSFRSVAYRMNLLSAICAGIAVALLYLLMLQISRSRIASAVAALMFAFSQEFWSQAVIAEVYAFQMLLMAALLGCVLAWDRRGDRHWLLASAVVYGFCCTHHGMSLLMLPGLLYFALTSPHRKQFVRELRWTLPLYLLPLTLYLYLPLAALRDTPSDWGDPRTWSNFIAHVTGKQYHPAMFHMTRANLRSYIQNYLGIGLKGNAGFLRSQFTPLFFWLAPVGAWSLARRRPRIFVLTLSIYLLDVIYAVNYYVFDVDVFYLPSHMMVAIWLACGLRMSGVGLGLLWRRLAVRPAHRRLVRLALCAGLFVISHSLLMANWKENDHHDDWGALLYARAALAGLKPNAILLGGGDNYYFPLLYTKFVENRRPDVMMFGYMDVLRPERVRLTTRLRPEGLIVRVPRGFRRILPAAKDDNRLLKAVISDNVGRRPFYVLGPPEALRMPSIAPLLASYYRVLA